MFKKMATTLLLAYASLQAQTPPAEIKYFININKDFKGVLHFKNTKKSTEIEYFNITSRDKIPFYAPSKEFSFTTLNKKPTLKTLEVGSNSKHMVYDLSTLSEEAIEEADINEDDMDSSAVIYNADDLPSEVLEKRVIHTSESLVLSIYETKELPSGPFYLYEPHKKMLIKVAFSKEGSELLKIGSKSCSTQTHVLKIVGRDKRLIKIYTNGNPLKVESFSKKWSFTIAGLGQTKKVRISNQEVAFRVFKDEVLDKYADFNVKILSQEVEDDVFDKVYITKFHVSKELNEEQLKKYLIKYTKNNRKMNFVEKKKDAYIFKVSNSDVIDLLEDKVDVEDDKHYWKEEYKTINAIKLLNFSAKDKGCKVSNTFKNDSTLICDGEEEDVDYEDILEEYYKEYKISKVKELKNNVGRVTKLSFKLKALREIDNETLYSFAVKAIQKKYPQNKFTNKLEFTKSKKEWKVYISKNAVQNSACEKLIPLVKSKYKDGVCQKTAKSTRTSKDTENILSKFIAKNYPDLEALGTDVHYGNDSVSFDYLNDLKKVLHGCK